MILIVAVLAFTRYYYSFDGKVKQITFNGGVITIEGVYTDGYLESPGNRAAQQIN